MIDAYISTRAGSGRDSLEQLAETEITTKDIMDFTTMAQLDSTKGETLQKRASAAIKRGQSLHM